MLYITLINRIIKAVSHISTQLIIVKSMAKITSDNSTFSAISTFQIKLNGHTVNKGTKKEEHLIKGSNPQFLVKRFDVISIRSHDRIRSSFMNYTRFTKLYIFCYIMLFLRMFPQNRTQFFIPDQDRNDHKASD